MRVLSRKSVVVLLCLLLAALLFATAAMPWVQATVATTVGELDVPVRGSDAAPAVSALSLVAAAGAVALTIAGRRVRPVVAALIGLSGIGSLLAVLGALRDPVAVSEGVVGEAAGVVGSDAQHVVTVWPWLSLVCALLVVLSGVWALIASRRWASSAASRYDRGPEQRRARPVDVREEGRRDDIDSWDALTEGRDPTGS